MRRGGSPLGPAAKPWKLRRPRASVLLLRARADAYLVAGNLMRRDPEDGLWSFAEPSASERSSMDRSDTSRSSATTKNASSCEPSGNGGGGLASTALTDAWQSACDSNAAKGRRHTAASEAAIDMFCFSRDVLLAAQKVCARAHQTVLFRAAARAVAGTAALAPPGGRRVGPWRRSLSLPPQVLMPHSQMPVRVRIGLHTGNVVSGVIGTKLPKVRACAVTGRTQTTNRLRAAKAHGVACSLGMRARAIAQFGLFGDTMNSAARMEQVRACSPSTRLAAVACGTACGTRGRCGSNAAPALSQPDWPHADVQAGVHPDDGGDARPAARRPQHPQHGRPGGQGARGRRAM